MVQRLYKLVSELLALKLETYMGTSSAMGSWPLKSLPAKSSFQGPLYVLVPETVDEGVQHGCDHSVHH